MERRIHRFACAVLALIALSLTGTVTECQWQHFVVQIPDLEINQVEGLLLWRADAETSRSFAEAGQVVFGNRFFEDGRELMQYTMSDSLGQPIDFLTPATVLRGADGNGPPTLVFFFTTWAEPPGWIRVSSFNAAGESELSRTAIFM
jgi:hypothetical protein